MQLVYWVHERQSEQKASFAESAAEQTSHFRQQLTCNSEYLLAKQRVLQPIYDKSTK